MREIKFRAWIPEGEWEEDGESRKMVMCYDLAFEDFEPLNDQLASVKHLMQFTGLHDKNGKEIWEGDIVRFPVAKTLPNGNLSLTENVMVTKTVAFGNNTIYQGFNIGSFQEKTTEVIGNIYEGEK